MNLADRFLTSTEYGNYEEFYSNVKLKIPDNFNFGYDVVDEYARLCPNKTALVWTNSDGDEKIFSFADMKRLSDKCANLFRSYGLKKGDIIMTMLARRYEFWIIAVACHKLGVTIIPATFMLCAKDISYRANSARIKMLIAVNEGDIPLHINEAKQDCQTIQTYMTVGDDLNGFINFDKELEKASEDFDGKRVTKNDDVMLLYFTSGTTGYPKMVCHNFIYPLGHIFTAKYWQKVKDDGLHLTMAETGWAKCSWGRIYGQWISGTAIFVYDYYGRFTPVDILPLIGKYHITTFCAPPTIYRFLIREDMSKYDFSSLTHCSTAGEALNPEVAKLFKDYTGQTIYEGFGQTESCVILGTFEMLETRYGSMGKPSPIYDIHLLDNDENDVPQGATGELCIKLPENGQVGLLCKYLNDEERTKAALGGQYYHTGDLATKDSEGYYWFVGRKDDIIKSSGYRIGPFEVESALHEHPAVLECAITGVPDPIRGQVVKATIVLSKGYEPSEELIKELQNHVKETTAPYKYPRVVEFVKELPKTYSGKIMRTEIRKKDDNK